jgi:hypothetical protein
MSSQAIIKFKKNQFGKNNKPHNIVETGTISKAAGGYKKIKIAQPNKWEMLHRYIWKQNHPDEIIENNETVIFADRNKDNLNPDNLIKVRKNTFTRRRKKRINAQKIKATIRKAIRKTQKTEKTTKTPAPTPKPKPNPVRKAQPAPTPKPKPVRKAPTPTPTPTVRKVRESKAIKLNLDEKKLSRELAIQQLELARNKEQDKIPVRIDSKTVIMIRKDDDKNTAIKNYLTKRRKYEQQQEKKNNGILINVLK